MRRRRIRLTFLLAGAALAAPVEYRAQAPRAPAPAVAAGPRPADVASEGAVIAALYDVLSGPAGQPRDWDRLRALFAPGARLMPTGVLADGAAQLRTLTVDEFVASSAPVLAFTGFYERELARRTERFGAVAHAFSTYESRRAPGDARPFQRGINSIQLWDDGRRWWIVTVLWATERPGAPIPPAYLPPAR
jgi:hypothetical protein